MESLHVVYCTDDNYVPVLGVSLSSLLKHDHEMKIHTHIIDMGISAENKERLKELCGGKGMECSFYSCDALTDILKGLKLHMSVNNNSIATLGRLYMGRVLPGDIERVLYLDCDTFITGSLKALCKREQKKTIMAVLDLNYSFYNTRKEIESVSEYFNAGVMLIDLPAYNSVMEQTDIRYYLEQDHHFADQDILNIIFRDDHEIIPPTFNSTIRTRLIKPANQKYWIGEPVQAYDTRMLNKAKYDPRIIHYTASLLGRPWEKACIDPSAKLWREEYEGSFWGKEGYKDKKLSWSNRLGRLMYKSLPESLFCIIDRKFAEIKYKPELFTET